MNFYLINKKIQSQIHHFYTCCKKEIAISYGRGEGGVFTFVLLLIGHKHTQTRTRTNTLKSAMQTSKIVNEIEDST